MKILTKDIIVQRRLKKAINKKIEDDQLEIEKLVDNVGIFSDLAKEIILDEMFKSETYRSLTSGKLRLDFGLSDSVVAALPQYLNELIHTYYRLEPFNGIKIVITIRHHRAASPETIGATTLAQYYSDRSGELVDWLFWLLFEGTSLINDEWKVKKVEGKGRSYMGYMVRAKENQGFSVDPYFAGVEGDNFVTKAMIAAKPRIEALLNEFK